MNSLIKGAHYNSLFKAIMGLGFCRSAAYITPYISNDFDRLQPTRISPSHN